MNSRHHNFFLFCPISSINGLIYFTGISLPPLKKISKIPIAVVNFISTYFNYFFWIDFLPLYLTSHITIQFLFNISVLERVAVKVTHTPIRAVLSLQSTVNTTHNSQWLDFILYSSMIHNLDNCIVIFAKKNVTEESRR